MKTIEDLKEELRFLQAKLTVIEQKKAVLFDVEGAIRIDMQRVENQIYRIRVLEKTPE